MKNWILVAVFVALAPLAAAADVSNEVIIGFEADSTSEAMDVTGADVTDKIDVQNSMFIAQYAHFFAPLKDDARPIELRTFYQHPAAVSVAMGLLHTTSTDNTIPTDTIMSGSMLFVGAQYYFPTDTGFFLTLGTGSGTIKDNTGGPETDLSSGQFELGLRQYFVPEAALHISLRGETTESKVSGWKTEIDKQVAFIGFRGVIKDTVGLMLELGAGQRDDKSSGPTISYDVAAVNAEADLYVGEKLSFRLAVEAEVEDMTGLPAGIEHTTTTSRSTLGVNYWFSERFGMALPFYAETTEHKTVLPFVGESKDRITNSGMGLYAAVRF